MELVAGDGMLGSIESEIVNYNHHRFGHCTRRRFDPS